LRWALNRDPENPEVLNMQGILLHTERRFEEAVPIFELAERLGNRAAASNRGNTLLDLGLIEDALVAHEKAVSLDPKCAGAQYNLAMTRLRLGDYERGWQGYESRWEFRAVHTDARLFSQPRWRGEELQGRTVLLHAEQGLGDAIQFSRYTQMVVERGGRALLQVHSGVNRLLHSLEVVRDGRASIADLGVSPGDFDLECPLMSLPAVFRTAIDTVPWDGPYIAAEPELIAEKQLEFPQLAESSGDPRVRPLRVGIAWAGNPGYRADRFRSTRLQTLLPLLQEPGVRWVSLQKGDSSQQIAELPEGIAVLDAGNSDRDLSDTAAVIASLDLVISTDTCIPHLAAALGKPVLLLLPAHSDWRWMREIETSPWYPTMRLIRQKNLGDWSDVVERALGRVREMRDAL